MGNDNINNTSIEEIFEFDSERELIGGRFFSLEEAHDSKHQKIAFRVKKQLSNNLTTDSYQTVMYPFFLKISDKDIVKPDIILTTEFDPDEHYSKIPEIVVEVLSISTTFKDNEVKLKLYEQEKILYYMIIDPKIGDIKIYKLEEGKYNLIATPQKRSNFEFILSNGKTNIDFNNVY
jgi:Uma2 family endonuclease